MSERRVAHVVVALVLAVLLGSCVGAGNGADERSDRRPHSGAVTVRDVRGVHRLPAPARRVVALGWTYAEDLVALGVQPVGVTEKADYLRQVGASAPLSARVADVGRRTEPNLDAIRDLRPDLIVTDNGSHANVAALEKLAPVLVFDPHRPDMTAWEEMRTTFRAVAAAVDRSRRAEAVLAELDAAMAKGRQRIADASKSEMPFVLAEGYSRAGVPVIRMFGETSLASETLQRLGLSNAWKGELDPSGSVPADVGDLAHVSSADFLYVAHERDDPFTDRFAHDPRWLSLEFVRSGRVHRLPPDTWASTGPRSVARAASRVVRALT